MSRLRAAGASDVGQIRAANEDSLYVGETVFAVADGMGGHLAGEVASAMALEPLASLDGKVFADADAARTALREAIERANQDVARTAADEPSYRGMGTTLTAVLLEGRRVHVGHVGDSRAYLVRDHQIEQLTDDHTLVQHLIDEGQITREEAATHPQRSIITRAIGVSTNVEVDSHTFELQEGDQILLCSDGLTGVVDEEEILDSLHTAQPLAEVVDGLVDQANAGGGPDNITVLLLRYGEPPVSHAASHGDAGALEGPGERRVVVRTDDASASTDWAQRLGRFGALGRQRGGRFEDDAPPGPARWQRWGAIAVGVVAFAALVIGGGRWLLSRAYYVGVDDGRVTIYQGIPADLGPFELSWVQQRTPLPVQELPAFLADKLREEGVPAVDLADARRLVEGYREQASLSAAGDGGPEPTATPTRSPDVSPSPTDTGSP